jgi:hypothetical protein
MPERCAQICHVFRFATDYERPQTAQCGEAVVPQLWAYRSPAIGFKEANPPQTVVVIEVQ